MSISILANVGNVGFALPMVQAYPVDVNSQYLLGWNPSSQALDYVPYVGNSLGDFSATRDLMSGRDTIVGEDLTVAGTAAIVGNTTIGGTLGVTGIVTFTDRPVFSGGVPALVSNGGVSGTSLAAIAGPSTSTLTPTELQILTVRVVGARVTGWAAATGTATRTTFDTATVTLPLLAQRVKALIDDLIAHGLIGT